MGRKADTVSEQRIARRWIVKANGAEQTEVAVGESVEIGRKPLRPLADDGFERMEIEDSSRSMSKRHAVFSVDEHGAAVLRDLNSTNGSYVVGDRGGLMRLQGGADFPLPMSPMRMQFGDVPVDFVQVEEAVDGEEEEQPAEQTPDLFSYAAAEPKPAEPGMADMSVDDILNLRAGEPTTAISTATVAGKVNALKASAAFSFPPTDDVSADDVAADDADGDDAFTDGAAADDAAADASVAEHERASHEASSAEADAEAPVENAAQKASYEEAATGNAAADATADEAADPGKSDDQTRALPQGSAAAHDGQPAGDAMLGHAATHISVNVVQPGQRDAVRQRDLFVDALSDGNDDNDVQAGAVAGNADEPRGEAQPGSQQSEDSGHAEHAGHPEFAGREIGVGEIFSAVNRNRGASDERAEQPDQFVQPEQSEPSQAAVQEITQGVSSGSYGDETAAFTPVFEPGSVFERVSKGDFGKREPAVDIDGLTSDDAKRTGDFTQQFEMAKHPQLLPFLAMNPSLYDDLYAWLAALGDKDIDAALSRNAGYEEYRTAVGK
ncbi:MAG: FHA domain-containing protein [Bifidobacterium tibiigranuli]|jgi:hypothetical protein|nr:FHA domain-containing protein [Bifidobacterium tibiigranuli]